TIHPPPTPHGGNFCVYENLNPDPRVLSKKKLHIRFHKKPNQTPNFKNVFHTEKDKKTSEKKPRLTV
ncbi:hypothetical protein, partial [Enterobacter intestinihominis]